MPTIAELQIVVDSKPVEQSTKALNDFAVAADKASKSTDTKRKSDEALAASSRQAATEADNSAKAANRQNKEFEALLGKIDPLTKKLNDLAKQEAALFANKDSLPTATFDAYNQKLQESFDKLMGLGTAQKEVAASSDGVPDRIKRIAEASYESARAQENLTTAMRGASEAEQGLVSSGAVTAANQRAKAALDEHNAKRQLTDSTNAVAGAEKNQAAGLDELLSKIDPAIRKMNELDVLQKKLDQNRAAGNLDTESYEKFTQTINRQRDSLTRYSDGLQNTGKSAKELAFAMRGLPAQFTDIVVSLQGGQAPLTVLLQQGGQIKDMFGGILPALKAMGQGLLMMITPVTVVGAGLAALAVAAYSGSQELTAFNRAAILSAGYSGVSAAGFTQMRDSLEGTGVNAGKAAEALTLLASGGQVVGDLFQKVAGSAVSFQKATGQALSETISDFNAIGKDPVDAAVRLDEKYKFLTSSVLAQAAALERNGQDSEAATLLQERLAEQVDKTAKQMIDQAGYIERAWNGVKGAVQGVWDAMKGVGREGDTNAEDLKRSQELLERTKTRLREGNLLASGMTDEEINNNPAVKYINAQIAGYQKLVTASEDAAKKQAEAEDKRRESIAATNASNRRFETTLKGVAKAEDDLRKVRLENSQIKGGGDTISSAQAAIMATNEKNAVEALAKAKEKAAKPKSSPIDSREVTEVRNNLTLLNAEYDGYYKRVTAIGQANVVSAEATFQSQKAILEAQKKAVASSYDDQIESIKKLRDNKKNSATQNISLDNQLSKAETDRIASLEKIDAKQDALAAKEEGRIKKRTENISAYKAALDAQLESLRDEGARAVDGVGRGDRQSGVDKQLAANDRSFDKQQRQLTTSLNSGMDIEEYTAKLKDLQDAHTAMSEQIIRNDADIQAANGDWTNGFTKALENAADAGRNFASSTERAVSGAFDSMGDALGTFVTTGKLDFRSLTLSIIADMAKIAAKQAASSALSSLFGAAMSIGSAYFGGANGFAAGSAGATSSSLGASAAGYSSQYIPQAKGGAWTGGTQFFANGGAFTNSIVSTPTMFSTGNGPGVMGEAGPEAIMPLARTSSGSLGVRMVGGGDGGGVIVYVNVTSDGTTSESTDAGYTQFGKEIGDFVDTRINVYMDRSLKSGGDLRRAINEK